MKKAFLFVALLCAVILSSSAISSNASAPSPNKERGLFRFDQPVELLGVTLKGQYLFVHDDAAMARGEACTFVYKGVSETKENLVVSFHCIPQNRNKVGSFTIRTSLTPTGITELTEIQFSGSAEGHLVPLTR